MSAKEKEMAELLARPDREEIFSAVMAYISPNVSAILDLGCGIGSLTSRLSERFFSALIVGIDRSKYLLGKLQSRRERNILTVLGDITDLPFENGFFDLVLTVQVLHEILHFKGEPFLKKTLQNIYELLKNEGSFIIFDHANPGDAPISLELSEELLEKLCEFQSKFKPRRITYEDLGKGRIRIATRDFYDFVTKIWALNTELEEEEMSETHTSFTCQELMKLIRETRFEIVHTASLTPINRHLEYYGISLNSAVNLPNRHIILHAKRIE